MEKEKGSVKEKELGMERDLESSHHSNHLKIPE